MRRKARAWASISSGERPQSEMPDAEAALMEDDKAEPSPPASAPSSAAAALRDTAGPPSCCATSRRMSAGERPEGAAAPCSRRTRYREIWGDMGRYREI